MADERKLDERLKETGTVKGPEPLPDVTEPTKAPSHGDVFLVRPMPNAKSQMIPAGTVLQESPEWPAHRIQFALQEGHAKRLGAELETGDAKEGFLSAQAKRLGIGGDKKK